VYISAPDLRKKNLLLSKRTTKTTETSAPPPRGFVSCVSYVSAFYRGEIFFRGRCWAAFVSFFTQQGLHLAKIDPFKAHQAIMLRFGAA
jgi:hypothetical protein